jgi:hypothetical protein
MDGHQHERLSDETLEREIEAALGVDPSPEFLPRIRARVASERMQEGWAWSASWRWTVAGAVVAVVAILGLWIGREQAPAPRETQIAGASPVEPVPQVSGPPFPSSAGVRPTVRAARSPQRVAVKPPEVLISNEESAALRQLFAAISDRRLETSELPDLAAALKPPAPIEDIVVEPIIISPLAPLSGE